MIKVLVAGDFCPQDRVEKQIEAGKFENVFGAIKQYTSKADYSIVNLEAPVVETNAKPIEKCGPNLRCTNRAVMAIKYAGFNLATLANNHFYDYGDDGVTNTINCCHKNEIDTVGGGMNLTEASRTLYKKFGDETIAIINCCEREYSIATEDKGGSNPLNPIQQYYCIKKAKENSDYVIVIVHGGHEFYNLPSPRMKETYRFFIDAGADAVINHHQHCYSGYETYNSKPIIYGVGNFCFDRPGKRNDIWNKGYIVELQLEKLEIKFNIIPYVQADAEACVKTELNKNELSLFENDIQAINAIISDDITLRNKHQEFMENTKKYFLLMAEPYTNRYLRALYFRGLLPSTMNRKRRTELLNYLVCESHIERFIYALKN